MKKKIKNDEKLTREQKRAKIQALRPKCVKCKKPVGTIFEIKGDSLRAVCGANNPQMASEGYKPCTLNINIKKPTIVNLDVVISATRDKRNKLMEQITLNKVKLLYAPREKQVELVEQIEQMKLEHREQCDLLETYIKKRLELAANDKESEELFLKAHGIGENIVDLVKQKKIKDAVEMYIEEYAPTVSLEMASKYKHVYMEQEGKDTFYLREVIPEDSFDVLDISIDNGSFKKKTNSNMNSNMNSN